MILKLHRIFLVSSVITIVSSFAEFSDRVPFKYKHREELGELEPRLKLKNRLAVPVHSRFRSAVEDEDDENYDDDINDSKDIYDNDDWSHTNIPLHADAEFNVRANHTHTSDNDNVVDILVNPKLNKINYYSADSQEVIEKVNNIADKKSSDEEADYKDSSAEIIITDTEAEHKDAQAKKTFILNSINNLKSKHTKKDSAVHDKFIEEQHLKEELEGNKWQSVDTFDKYGYITTQPLEYYDEYYEKEMLSRDKYTIKPLKKTVKELSATTQPSISKKSKSNKKNNKKTVTTSSLFTHPRSYMISYNDDSEKSSKTSINAKTVTEPTIFKQRSASEDSNEDDSENDRFILTSTTKKKSHITKHKTNKLKNENVRLNFVPMNFGSDKESPTLFFPIMKEKKKKIDENGRKRASKRKKKHKRKKAKNILRQGKILHKNMSEIVNGSETFQVTPSLATVVAQTSITPSPVTGLGLRERTVIVYVSQTPTSTTAATVSTTFPSTTVQPAPSTTFELSKAVDVPVSSVASTLPTTDNIIFDSADEDEDYEDSEDEKPYQAVLFKESEFGKIDNETVKSFAWKTKTGFEVTVISYGAIITSIKVPDKNKSISDVVLGFDNINSYLTLNTPDLLGAVVGRCVGRISNAQFEVNGYVYKLTTNCGPHHLHGGYKGFDKQNWSYTTLNNKVIFSHLSKDGTEGYPGDVIVNVSYEVTNDNTLHVEYTAITNKPTVVNLSNHSYFNLAGHETGAAGLLEHNVVINSDKIVDSDSDWIPTGRFHDVGGTPFDLRTPRRLSDVVSNMVDLRFHHNYVITRHNDTSLNFVSRVEHPLSGRFLEVYSDQPSVIFYTGNYIQSQGHPDLIGKGGVRYGRCAGLCLETMNLVDAVNHQGFPSAILNPGQVYKHTTLFRFGAV